MSDFKDKWGKELVGQIHHVNNCTFSDFLQNNLIVVTKVQLKQGEQVYFFHTLNQNFVRKKTDGGNKSN